AHTVTCVAWTRDGPRLVSGGFRGTINIWDARGGDLLASRPTPFSTIYAVAVSPEGARLAVAGEEGHDYGDPSPIPVYDLATGPPLLTYRGHTVLWTDDVAWSLDGR